MEPGRIISERREMDAPGKSHVWPRSHTLLVELGSPTPHDSQTLRIDHRLIAFALAVVFPRGVLLRPPP